MSDLHPLALAYLRAMAASHAAAGQPIPLGLSYSAVASVAAGATFAEAAAVGVSEVWARRVVSRARRGAA